MKKLIAILFAILIGCQNSSDSVSNDEYFDLPGFTREILDNMNNPKIGATKRFILNSATESKTFDSTDSVFWANEFDLLMTTDLNASKYQRALIINERERDNSSNLLIDKISPTTENIDLKKLEIYYLNDLDQIRKIYLELSSKNFISSSSLTLTAWFNQYGDQLLVDSVVTKGKDKVVFQEERVYGSHLKRIRR